VNLLAEEKFTQKGISPPEYLGEDESNFKFIMAHLKARGVNYHVKTDG
jgi:saccharopine dehydrogenase-like NADP-dependent oxidoreductase